nr:DUF2920 family protein [uncultured Campylobacter sp.]
MKFTKFFCDDVELNIKRESMLEFKLYCDDRGPVKAIVFIIPGLGSDTNSSCREHLAQFVSDKFNLE